MPFVVKSLVFYDALLIRYNNGKGKVLVFTLQFI